MACLVKEAVSVNEAQMSQFFCQVMQYLFNHLIISLDKFGDMCVSLSIYMRLPGLPFSPRHENPSIHPSHDPSIHLKSHPF